MFKLLMTYNMKNTSNSNVIYNFLQNGNRESLLSGGKNDQISQFYKKRKHKSISDLVFRIFSKNECTGSRVSMSAKVKNCTVLFRKNAHFKKDYKMF